MAAALRSLSAVLRPLISVAQRSTCNLWRSACKFSTLNVGCLHRTEIKHSFQPSMTVSNHLKCSPSIFQSVVPLLPNLQQPSRPLTYYSLRKGKRKSAKAVVKRFLRLHCGLWLRRKAGYKKKLWKKKPAHKRRLQQHVFCNKTQSKLLDKMTTSFWKRRNWFANDPYLKYHDRPQLKV
ncbi:39S ribosomal protein L35, mitochondrial isoform X1 [Erpetoichthys calabaricus]|uniref:39S ribosomal protein L35, mitochondrial isoform X1 n=1 Tax=Erpetoichthys calabaricus TaxID=27687 RepID=UPI0010A0B861|nr:39S ribosomal protein L35, mitochondrial isoform X1 [Erpetoichthys calabaricus]